MVLLLWVASKVESEDLKETRKSKNCNRKSYLFIISVHPWTLMHLFSSRPDLWLVAGLDVTMCGREWQSSTNTAFHLATSMV